MTLARMVLVYCLLTSATPASAQSEKAQADVLFREGRKLMTAGEISQASAAFQQSQRLDPAVTTLINLAACREKLGQLATAWRLFLEAAQQTQSASDDTRSQLHKIALDRATKLEPRVSKLMIRVSDQSKVDRLEILRDGERIPDEIWNRLHPIDGGTYMITARAPGVSEWSTHATLASEADTITVDIPDLRDGKSRLVTSSEATDTRRRWATWKPWAVVAVGGVFTGASGFLHGLAYKNFKSFDAKFQHLECWQMSHACTSDQIPSDLNTQLTRARRQQMVAFGGYIASGSLIAAGIMFLYLNRLRPGGTGEQRASDPPGAHVAIIPTISEEMAGILVSVRH